MGALKLIAQIWHKTSFLRRGNRCYQYNIKNWDTVSLYERPGIFWAGLGPVQIGLKLHDLYCLSWAST